MKMRFIQLLISVLSLFPSSLLLGQALEHSERLIVKAQQPAASAAPVFYSHGDPTNDEQYLLQLLNRGRMDPVGEGQRLEAWLDLPANILLVSAYGLDPATVAAQVAAFPAVPPLAFNAELIAAARGHTADMIATNGTGHTGSDGSTPDQRVAAAGFTALDGGDGYGGENFAPGVSSPYEVHAGYFVDWGNPDLGHLKNSMNAGNSGGANNVIGIGLTTNPKPVYSGFPVVETEDYGTPGVEVIGNKYVPADVPAQLVGVVYADANGNGEYDSGEGVAGATVTMNGGYYYTVTSASGGYALPLVNADGSNVDGPVTVQIAMPGSNDVRTATITVSDYDGPFGSYRGNVEWDSIVIPPNPAQATIIGGGTVQAGSNFKLKVARPADSDLTQPVTVAYKLKGTAVAGVNYVALPGTITIPAGASIARIKVRAMAGSLGSTTLEVKLKRVAGFQGEATIMIVPSGTGN